MYRRYRRKKKTTVWDRDSLYVWQIASRDILYTSDPVFTYYSLRSVLYRRYSRTEKTIMWDSLARLPLEIFYKPLTLYSLIILYHLHCIGGTGKRRKLQCGTETADMSGESPPQKLEDTSSGWAHYNLSNLYYCSCFKFIFSPIISLCKKHFWKVFIGRDDMTIYAT